MERECSVSRTVMDTECGWGGIGQELAWSPSRTRMERECGHGALMRMSDQLRRENRRFRGHMQNDNGIVEVWERARRIVMRKWGGHQDARDAAMEAFSRWLGNGADKAVHPVGCHVHYIVLHAGELLSPNGRRAMGRRMRPLAGRYGMGGPCSGSGQASPAEDAWRARMHGVAGGSEGSEQEDATIEAIDTAAERRRDEATRDARPKLDASEWKEALDRLRGDGWTQPQIAAACGCTTSMAGKWLRGAVPHLTNRGRIAAATDGRKPPDASARSVMQMRRSRTKPV